jgi:molecular chaperone DnaJ|uniref:Chaperone protein DnaJ n=1 Tax=Desulfobacca acetoxidans TaxID=60893 RepID=A0A7C5EMH7_9BACT
MTIRESYRILGLSARAGWEEVRRRFRALAQEYHPDLNPDKPEAAAQFRQVLEAYETLRARLERPPVKEKKYYRRNARAKQEFFEEVFGLHPQTEPGPPLGGPDFRYDLRISFEDAFLGAEATIMVPRFVPCAHCRRRGRIPLNQPRICPDCGGRGQPLLGPGLLRSSFPCSSCQGQGIILEHPCSACQGQGYRLLSRPYHLRIPPGIEDGSRLSFACEGGESYPGGPPGNLEVVISVEPHSFFTRRGRDLYCQVNVSFAQAALGDEIRVPTLNGSVMLKIPRGTQNGCIFRFPAVPPHQAASGVVGDQIVEVVVTTPERLTLAQRHILEEVARLGRTEMG